MLLTPITTVIVEGASPGELLLPVAPVIIETATTPTLELEPVVVLLTVDWSEPVAEVED